MLRKAEISNMMVVYLACVATATAFTPTSIAPRYAFVRAVACSAAGKAGHVQSQSRVVARELTRVQPRTNSSPAPARNMAVSGSLSMQLLGSLGEIKLVLCTFPELTVVR